MAEISQRRIGELARGVFKILLDTPDGLPAKEVLARLPAEVPPTSFEKEMYPKNPNVRRYEKIVRFSTIASVKAGWLVKSKGIWSLTEEGRSAYQKYPDPETFHREAYQLYKKWKAAQPTDDTDVGSDDPEAASATTTLEEAEESAWAEIETYLTGMNPYLFQDLIAGLLTGMGYHVAWVAPPGPDRGVDLIAQADPLGVTGPRIKVQVKRSGAMPPKEVRSFLAVLSDGDVGLFVSAGGFTKEAEAEMRHEKRRITLVNLQRLFDLWVEHYDRIPEDRRNLLPLKPVYFLTPRD